MEKHKYFRHPATYNEKDPIAGVIEDFLAAGYIDERLVVNNNTVAGTDTGATRVVSSP